MNLVEKFSQYINKHPTSKFISLEGIEGSGKSTQINYLRSYYEDLGYKVITLREPGGTVLGEKVREIILTSEEKITEISEAYLFAASRAHLLKTLILPALEKEKHIVILDRYIDSSLAYQGISRGLGIETVLQVHSHYPLNYLPDITFYLKIDIETSFKRQEIRGAKKDYFEKENQNFYKKLIEGYTEAVKLFPKRIVEIDATKNQEEIFQSLKDYLKSHG